MKHGKGYYSAVANSKHGRSPDIEMVSAKRPAKVKAQSKRKAFNTKARSSSGWVHRAGARSTLYTTRIKFDSIELRTGSSDLKTALDHLLILTSVKQKMRNHTGAGSFVERLQAAMVSSATEQGRNLADLKLSFHVHQSAGCFIGTVKLMSPCVRSLEVFGKMRSLFEPFRQYAKQFGKQSVYWRYSPAHLEDAWERFQSAVARAWQLAGVDSTAILQKFLSLYEAQAPFRSANLQRWEQKHMAMEDKNKHRPRHLRERNPAETTSMQLSALKKLIVRWGQVLKREARLLEKERQKVIQRRLEVLKQKRQREEERSR